MMPYPLQPGEAALLSSAEPLSLTDDDRCIRCGAPLDDDGELYCPRCAEEDYSEEQDRLEELACQRDRERVGMPSQRED